MTTLRGRSGLVLKPQIAYGLDADADGVAGHLG